MSKANDKMSYAKRRRIVDLKKSISLKRMEQEALSVRLAQAIRSLKKQST